MSSLLVTPARPPLGNSATWPVVTYLHSERRLLKRLPLLERSSPSDGGQAVGDASGGGTLVGSEAPVEPGCSHVGVQNAACVFAVLPECVCFLFE